MTINFSAGDEPPTDLLAAVEDIYRKSAKHLIATISRIEDDPGVEAKSAAPAIKELKAAFQMVMEERTRVEKLRKQTAGTVGASALDFDSARNEIGRRLACLRDAGTGG